MMAVKFFKIYDNKASADHVPVEKFINEFAKVNADKSLMQEVCNTDEMLPFWHY
jgi:hypothetical protein